MVRELLGDAGAAGDWAWIRIELGAGGEVAAARGAGPGVQELCRAIRGLTLLEAAAVPGERLAVDALASALAPAVGAERCPRRVAVAMSGGVDSAVALLDVRAAGYQPVGLTLRLWLDPAGPDSERACCSPSAVVAARELCHRLGVPHVTLDLRETFRRAIVRPFVDAYRRGETPNPCVACNGGFRFDELLAAAARIGASRLATGHYARLRRHRGRLLLARGADPGKDQSYMLGRVPPARLARLWFPLGERTKDETRAAARAAGLEAAGRPESQEACFLAGDDYRGFLARHGLRPAPGPLLGTDGSRRGTHDGYWRFTPGQRRGIGLASSRGPLYAISTDARTNAVVVGPREALARTRVQVRPGELYVPVTRAEVRLRYRGPGQEAAVAARGGGDVELRLDEPAYGVAPGQAAVLYEDDVVVGAGLVAAAT